MSLAALSVWCQVSLRQQCLTTLEPLRGGRLGSCSACFCPRWARCCYRSIQRQHEPVDQGSEWQAAAC